MNTVVETINAAGRAFVDFSLPMLVQSVLLILILLAADTLLRRRVRAVFRYWVWMLVLVKLVLPPSLGSPVSVGTWFGDSLQIPTERVAGVPPARAEDLWPSLSEGGTSSTPAGKMPATQRPPMPEAAISLPAPEMPVEMEHPVAPETGTIAHPPALTWQGLALLIWSMVVSALTLLLLQRAFFVQGLIGQAQDADPTMQSALEECRRRLGLRRRVALRLSPNAAGPAVCGLFRPVILIPQTLAPRLQGHDLQAILLHELAHVKRHDLWINLAQTLLQIVYFYNPLLWLANAMIRRTREQAVDETVLVAMGEEARQYPETLVNVARLAFTRRPALSLRLIGVVESKSALTARIRHILSRPLPKTARLGVFGLVIVCVMAAILLPMARATEGVAEVDSKRPLSIRLMGVCPDGGDELYDADGRKLDVTLAPLGASGDRWEDDRQRRDFVFQVPPFDGQLLFFPFPLLCPAGTDYSLGGSYLRVFNPGNGPSTMVLSCVFPRTYRRVGSRLFRREAPIRNVDITLRYFHGPRGEGICTFTGPFALDTTVQADGGRSYLLTPESEHTRAESHIRFHLVTDQPFDRDEPVVLYDRQGRRYLASSYGGTSGPQGTRLTYEAEAMPWDQIAAVTMGEKPHEATFRNVVVDYPGRPMRTYPAYLDRMAERLGLTDLSPEELVRYEFKNAQEAIDVLDILRDPGRIRNAMWMIQRRRPNLTSLDTATREKLRRIGVSWLQSPSVSIRAYGVELGLRAGFREFVDPAFALLEYLYPIAANWDREARMHVLAGLGQWCQETEATEEIERLKHLVLHRDAGQLSPGLFEICLRRQRHATGADALWEFAQEDRPWLWWPAIHQLLLRGDTRLRAYSALSEAMKVRLILVGDTEQPDQAALAPKVRALLSDIFTADMLRLCPSCDIRQAVARHLDRREATTLYMRFLGEVSDPLTRWRYEHDRGGSHTLNTLVLAMVRDINLWYGVDLGGLGVYEPDNRDQHWPGLFVGSRFAQLVAETLSWYEANRGAEPRELPFRGRVVDTAGRPVPMAELSLARMERQGDQFRSQHDVAPERYWTDADGGFVFRNLANTHHTLRVVADGFAARERLSVTQLPDGRFRLSDGAQGNVIVLEKPASLSGRVIGRDGRPLASHIVHFWSYPIHGVPVLGRRTLDDQGHFADSLLMSGYHLIRYGERRQIDGAPQYEGVTAFRLVHVPEGQAVDDVVLDLRESTASLEIEIVDRDGRPMGVEHLSLQVAIPSGKPPFAAVLFLSDVQPQSVHRFPNLPPMEGYVDVIGPSPQRIPVKLVPNQVTRCRVELDYSPRRGAFVEPATNEPTEGSSAEGGPLDIQLIAVRPDAGSRYYDPAGKRLDWNPGFLPTMAYWGHDQYIRDFILQMPDTNEQVLFGKWHEVHPVDSGRRYKRNNPPVGMGLYEGNQFYRWPLVFPRRYDVGTVARLIPRYRSVHQVDLTLRYFYGPPREPTHTFVGPFTAGETFPAGEDASCTVTCQEKSPYTFRFTFSPSLSIDSRTTILLYDTDGRRRFPQYVHRDEDSWFFSWRGSLDRLAGITIGEQPYERVFRNVVVRYPDDPSRAYAPYVDRMVEVIDLQEHPKEQIDLYEFRTPDEALAVIDLIQSIPLIDKALGVFTFAYWTESPEAAARDKLQSVAHKWTDSLDVQMRLKGVRLGLLARSPEFFDQAVTLLEDDYSYLPHGGTAFEDHRNIAMLLSYHWQDRLSPPQREDLEAYSTAWHPGPIFRRTSKGPSGGGLVEPAGSPDRDASTPARVIAELPNGMAVELLGVCEHPSEGRQWWRPDGSEMTEAPHHTTDRNVHPHARESAYEFAVWVSGLPDGAAVTMKTEPAGSGTTNAGYDGLRWLATALPEDLTTCTLLCGIAAGEWETAAQTTGKGGQSTGMALGGVSFSPAMENADSEIVIAVTDDILDRLSRVVAATIDGRIVQPYRSRMGSAGKARQTTAYFRDLALTQIAEFRFQTRPWEWVEFDNVSLRPGRKGDAQVSIRLNPDVITPDKGAGGGALVEPGRTGGVLEFRVAAGMEQLSPQVVEEYRKALIEGRKPPEGRYLWVPVRAGTNLPPLAVGETHEGRPWLLLWDAPSHAMLAGLGWGLKTVYETTDAMGQPAVRLIFDEKGAQLLHELTRANVNKSLAIILDGQVLSAPTIMMPLIGGQGIITGNFTAEEVDRMITVLKEAMSRRRQVESSHTDDAARRDSGEAIPADANDTKRLAPSLNIYLLKDENIDFGKAAAMPLSDLVLRDEPWITGDNIELYDWSTHHIHLKEGARLPFERVSLRDNPFVVTADGERCYLGSLWTPFRSFWPPFRPLIQQLPMMPPGVIAIQWHDIPFVKDSGHLDPRSDQRILNALRRQGQYRAGLWVSLDRVELLPGDGGSSVRYTYTIQNQDSDDLLILDPDSMGAELFHCFHNGPSLRPARGHAIGPQHDDRDGTVRPLGLDLAWLSLLPSGASMTRTVTRGGYPMIPPGEYECTFVIRSPGAMATKDKRADAGTRIWLGEIPATLTVQVRERHGDSETISGRVLDPDGRPAAGAQVALITATAGVTIDGGRLLPPRFVRVEKATIVETDAQGRFRFESEPKEGFSLVAAHDAGFALVGSDVFAADRVIRLEKWGRVEGQVAEGRWPLEDQIWMAGLPNETWLGHRRECLYDGLCDSQGRFTFSKVPPGWFEVGYLIRTGDSTSTHTSRTPIVVRSGETTKVTLGGEGRPVIGRFVPPEGYSGPIYFGEGLRSLATWRPELPKPADYDQMTKRQQQEWLQQWWKTPESRAWSDAIRHDLNRRCYAFRIQKDGTFRIEDVIAGKYTMTVHLEREPWGQAPPQEDLGGYHGTVEVSPIPGGRSDEPLELGDLVLRMNEPPLKVGETAPLFEAKSLDSRDI